MLERLPHRCCLRCGFRRRRRMVQEPLHDFDPSVLIGDAPDEPLVLQGTEAVDGGFVRGNLTGGLDFADKRGLTVFGDVRLDIVEHRLLLLGQQMIRGQTGLRR